MTLWNTASQGDELALPILDLLHRLPQQNPGVPPAGQGLQGENKGSATPSDSQPAAAAPPESPLQYLFAKSKPPSPPKGVEVEPDKSPEQLVDAKEITVTEEPERARSSGRRRRSPSRRKRSSRSRRGEKDKRRNKSRSRSHRRRGDHPSPNTSPRREKKRRSEPHEDRRSPLRPRSPPFPPGPRSPPGPPPRRHQEQGRGWQGPVPYSDHPRWTEGTNKGLVKRSKQERHYQRRQQHHQHGPKGKRWT